MRNAVNLPSGKLPLHILRELLQNLPATDPAVLVGATPGEDAAALDLNAENLLVIASDPITFTTTDVGRYLLAVNGNALAVMGAEPRWLLTTILMPLDSTVDEVRALLTDIVNACTTENVVLIGGHTEITPNVLSPIVVGSLLGTTTDAQLVKSSGAMPDDALLAVGGLAIEGTTILARDHAEQLRQAGVDPLDIEAAAGWLDSPGISVAKAAAVLRKTGTIHAMHDPTEGGITAALHELADAARVGILVDRNAIPVMPECQRICRALDLDPYSLLASGTLVAAVPMKIAETHLHALHTAGLSAALIGQVTASADDRLWTINGDRTSIPLLSRDELARFLDMA